MDTTTQDVLDILTDHRYIVEELRNDKVIWASERMTYEEAYKLWFRKQIKDRYSQGYISSELILRTFNEEVD